MHACSLLIHGFPLLLSLYRMIYLVYCVRHRSLEVHHHRYLLMLVNEWLRMSFWSMNKWQRWGLESLDSDSSRTRVPILLDSDSSPSHLDSDSRHADSDSTRTRTVGTRPDSANCTDKNRFQATRPLKSYSNVKNLKAKFRKRRDAYRYCLVFTRNRYITCQTNIKTFRHFLGSCQQQK